MTDPINKPSRAIIPWALPLGALLLVAGANLFVRVPAHAQQSKDSANDASQEKAEAQLPPQLARGRVIYMRRCVGCHGVAGDGQGEAASMLYPSPRDFVQADYKFSSGRTPEPPTEDDLMQVLTEGLKGTSMPAFRLMPDSDKHAVIAYIRTFSDRWEYDETFPIPKPEDPWAYDPEGGVRRGDEIYHLEAMCWTCHPAYHSAEEIGQMYLDAGMTVLKLRIGARLPVPRESPEGTLTLPPDFKRDWIKTGASVENLYRVIGAGITTTAMPTWADAIEPEALWALARYVSSIAEQRPYRLDPANYEPRPPFDLLLQSPDEPTEPEPATEPEDIEFEDAVEFEDEAGDES